MYVVKLCEKKLKWKHIPVYQLCKQSDFVKKIEEEAYLNLLVMYVVKLGGIKESKFVKIDKRNTDIKSLALKQKEDKLMKPDNFV